LTEKNTNVKGGKQMQLEDKDMSRDMELMLKQLAQSYSMAELDAANKPLRDVFQRLHQEMGTIHAKIFHAMHSRGWYKTAVAGQQAIESETISWEQKQIKQPELTQPQ
jgi:spore coat protein CotF